jgi:hypothetical protein
VREEYFKLLKVTDFVSKHPDDEKKGKMYDYDFYFWQNIEIRTNFSKPRQDNSFNFRNFLKLNCRASAPDIGKK